MNTAHNVTALQAPVQPLLETIRRYGTPTYAYDLDRVRAQVAALRVHLPHAVNILYSCKANASLGLCELLAQLGIGADVASAGELFTAIEAGFSAERIFVAGPYKSSETVRQLRSMPETVISIDSCSELQLLAGQELPNRAVLRLRPDFDSSAAVATGPDSRFGVPLEELAGCRRHLAPQGLKVVGFHVYAGSQVLDAAGVNAHLRGALDLSMRAADVLGINPEIINLGGGFGTPYEPAEPELELAAVGEELEKLLARAAPAELVIELGRFLVAQAGWYLTSVVAHQTYHDRRAVVVDGGTHQRSDLCGLGLRTRAAPPVALDAAVASPLPTDVLGCLSLPTDLLAESSPLPPLAPGNVLAFPNAGAYGLWASPALFHGYPLPAEVAFEGTTLRLMRARQEATSVLEGQVRLEGIQASSDASRTSC